MSRPASAFFAHGDPAVLNETIKPGTLRRTLLFALPQAGLIALFLLTVLLGAGIGITYPLIYRELINHGVLEENAPLVIDLACLIALLGVCDAILGLLQTYLSVRVGGAMVLSLRTRMFRHIQDLPLAFFRRTQTGALVNRLSSDVAGTRTALADILSNGAGNLVSVCLIVGAMFMLSWQITLVMVGVLLLFVLPARKLLKIRLQRLARESTDLMAALNAVMAGRFTAEGALHSRLFGDPEADRALFQDQARRVAGVGVRQAVYGRIFFTALLLVATLATALAYGWGGVLVVHHELDLGTVVAMGSYLLRLYVPLLGLSKVRMSVMTALASFGRVFELLDLTPMIQEKPGAVPLPAGPARIEFVHVSFQPPSTPDVSLPSLETPAFPEAGRPRDGLQDVSFTVEPGQRVALVGASGGGKILLTHLVPRLYDVTGGAVRIDGIDVRDTTLGSLRARIGIVTPDAQLFHESIRANLAHAAPGADENAMWEALRAVRMTEVIDALPDGLDTRVGERGYGFSNGETQRLALARLLLKAPGIVILDEEASAHLDAESENILQAALERALAGRSSIVIAHRLPTLVDADQILVVQEGRIVERGTHAQLLARGGAYAELIQRQFGVEAGTPVLVPVFPQEHP